eukprot:TRINITY_DN2237_c0_g2_i1.p2 TRINITY_DN2237_c0_g2~~TRINITY_DN2237_c0_g2_i1.p2  ORF type:complete len:140 (-),score=9.55 TRINITY_DN2237_c0_g2_i1:439-858(-)
MIQQLVPKSYKLPQLRSRSLIKSVGQLRIPTTISMALKIEKWDESKYGKLNRENMRSKMRQEGYSVTFYSFQPGTVFPDHTHGMDKKDSILSGQFLFRMNGQEVILRAGDMIEVPKGVVHYAEVVGTDSVEFGDGSKSF